MITQMNTPATKAPLRASGLSKTYGNRTLFIDLDLEVGASERIALLGPSGTGKSTLLHCLSGVEAPTAGEVYLADIPLSSLKEHALNYHRRQHLGTVFQFFHLLPTLNAFENIELPLQLVEKPKKERQERVETLLERLGIDHLRDAFPERMSGGEMQRVAIARAVAHRPAILFADEPTGNLDRASGEQALALLDEICSEEKMALLMVTHSEQAASICQRRLVLEEGALKQS